MGSMCMMSAFGGKGGGKPAQSGGGLSTCLVLAGIADSSTRASVAGDGDFVGVADSVMGEVQLGAGVTVGDFLCTLNMAHIPSVNHSSFCFYCFSSYYGFSSS